MYNLCSNVKKTPLDLCFSRFDMMYIMFMQQECGSNKRLSLRRWMGCANSILVHHRIELHVHKYFVQKSWIGLLITSNSCWDCMFYTSWEIVHNLIGNMLSTYSMYWVSCMYFLTLYIESPTCPLINPPIPTINHMCHMHVPNWNISNKWCGGNIKTTLQNMLKWTTHHISL